MLTIPLPGYEYIKDGYTSYKWLGSLWTSLASDKEFIRENQQANALMSQQLYENFLEVLNLSGRATTPVYHRERWRMVVVKLSERGQGDAVALKVQQESDLEIGKQSSMPYIPDSYLNIGGYLPIVGLVSYPITDNIQSSTVICDNITNPTYVLSRGTDFDVRENTIVFLNGIDPSTLGFPRRKMEDDTEIAMWVSDATFDTNYLNTYGTLLGINDTSSEEYSAYLNKLWEFYNKGSALSFREAVAAILNEPYIKEDTETVQFIIESPTRKIATDKNVYTLTSTAELNDLVSVGAVLTKGYLLTKTVRIFDNILPHGNPTLFSELQTAVPALFLTPAFFAADLKQGIGFAWNRANITYHGRDANDNPKLKMEVYGHDYDLTKFWDYFWKQCEDSSVSSEDYFVGSLYPTTLDVTGSTWGKISPLEFLITNFMTAGLLIVSLDSAKLSAAGRQHMGKLTELRKPLPVHVYYLVHEQYDVGTDEYELDGETPVEYMLSKAVKDSVGFNGSNKIECQYIDQKPKVQYLAKCL